MAVSAVMALASTGMAAASGTLIVGAFGMSAFMTTFVVKFALGAALKALTPKPSFSGSNRGYQTTAIGTALDHQIIYGKMRVGGARIYDEATGDTNKYLHRIIAVAGHEIQSFDKIYINDSYVNFDDIDADGNVSTVTDADETSSDRYNGKLRIKFHLGSPTQTADTFLVAESAHWTSSCKLSGIAYMYIRMEYDADVYPDGIPEITAEVKGKKVYDPRTSTTAWSDNPALCLRDYLISPYGIAEETANIDDTLVITAADVCDQTNTDAGTTRYTCNGAFTTASTPYDMINAMLTSMDGSLWYAQGSWRMKPAYWTTPVLDLNEDDLRSSISVSTRHSRRNNFNTVKGTFRGLESNWQTTDYPQVTNRTNAGDFVIGGAYAITSVGTTDFTTIGAASNDVGEVFVATGVGSGSGYADANLGADGGQESVADVDLPFTDNSIEARRIARISLERNRQQLTVTASFGLKTLQVQVGDNIRLTNSRFGWVAKEFEVVAWNFGLTDGLDLQTQMTLRETAESVYDEVDDGAVYERDNTTLPSPYETATPQSFAAAASAFVNEDGTTVPEVTFTWSVVNSSIVDHYEFQWKFSTDSTYNSVLLKDPKFILSPAESNKSYDSRVRSVNALGVQSQFISSASPINTSNDTTIPSAPGTPTVSGGYAATTVEWAAPTTNTDASAIKDLFQYAIYRGTSTNPTTLVGRVAGTTFSDIGLSDSTTYYYRVKALDFTGNASVYSANGNGTTNPTLVDGTDGLNNATVFLYNKSSSATAPTLFSGTFTYTFSTGVLSGGTLNGWTQEPPNLSQGDNLWVSLATASSRTATDSSIPTAEFSTPEITGIAGTDGSAGPTGASTNIIFIRSSSAPSTPADSSGIPTNWYDSPPAGTNILWASSGVKSVGSTTFTWGSPFQIEGESVAEVSIYRLNSNTGASGGSYNFVTNTLTSPTNWSSNPPSVVSNLDVVYRASGITSGAATQTAATVSYGSPVIYAQRTDGTDGANTARVSLFRKTTTNSAPADPSGTFTYTFATGVLSGGTLNSWSQSAPSLNNGEYLWIIQASAFSSNATDTIAASEFNAAAITGIGGTNGNPAKLLVLNATDQVFTFDADNVADPTSQTITFTAFLENTDDTTATWSSSPSVTLTGTGNTRSLSVANFGSNTSVTITASADSGAVSDTFTVYRLKDGATGATGLTGASTDAIFKRSATQPTTPSASAGTPTGWSTNPPSGTELLWSSSGVKAAGSSTYSWSTPFQIEGESVAEVSIYRKNISTGASGGSYNFVTNALTPPTNWTTNPPALSTNGDVIYRATGTTSGAATQTSATVSYGTVVTYATRVDGSTGADGEGALTLILSNEAHTFAADKNGVVASYSGSGTTVKLFEGTTELIYQQGSTAASRWSISSAGTSITPGSVTDSGNFATVDNQSNMTADTASITYTITGKRADGSAISLTKTQSFSKSKVGADGASVTGPTGARGAGRWNIQVSTLPTTSGSADTAFTAAIGDPVDKDQAWFYTGTESSPSGQSVWIYASSGDTWSEQDEVIDGNLLVSGTVTAAQMETGTITAASGIIGDLAITSATIAATIQSTNYSAGSDGWKINKSGSVEFQDAVIRGTLNAGDITGGTLNVARLPGIGVAGATTANSSFLTDNSGNVSLTVAFSGVTVGSSMMAIITGRFGMSKSSPSVSIVPTGSGVTLAHTQSTGGSVSENAGAITPYNHGVSATATSTSGTLGFTLSGSPNGRMYYACAVSLLTFKA